MTIDDIRENVLQTLRKAREVYLWRSLEEIVAEVPWSPPDPALSIVAQTLLKDTTVKFEGLTRKRLGEIVANYLEELEKEGVIDRSDRPGDVRFKMRPDDRHGRLEGLED